MPKAIIVSMSSDIGHALAQRWLRRGIELAGTFRTPSPAVKKLKEAGITLVSCDLLKSSSVTQACRRLRRFKPWDMLVLCPGALEPVGPFAEADFTAWSKSLEINFTRQLQFVHSLLPFRNRQGKPVVLFFAGGGTNNATVNYSAYTVSKIALIKMCELLDAEITDTGFVIIGPGWVKTKIHQATLKAGPRAGANYRKTQEKLASQECTPMEDVLDCCDWAISAGRPIVSGRNFSVVFDDWGKAALTRKLSKDNHMYKLRRSGNISKDDRT